MGRKRKTVIAPTKEECKSPRKRKRSAQEVKEKNKQHKHTKLSLEKTTLQQLLALKQK